MAVMRVSPVVLVWVSKPLRTFGLWCNQVVMGVSHFFSTAMGPFTYQYFAAGFIAGIDSMVNGVITSLYRELPLILLFRCWVQSSGSSQLGYGQAAQLSINVSDVCGLN